MVRSTKLELPNDFSGTRPSMYQVDANQDSEITVVEARRQRAWPNQHCLKLHVQGFGWVRFYGLVFKEGQRCVLGRRVEASVGFGHAGIYATLTAIFQDILLEALNPSPSPPHPSRNTLLHEKRPGSFAHPSDVGSTHPHSLQGLA